MMMRCLLSLWTAGCLLILAPVAAAGATDRTQEWIEVLQSDAPIFQKARACQQLGESGTEQAVPALAALLDHKILSAYARAGLERIPGPKAAAALREALHQTEGKCLVGVINSIAALRDEQAVDDLIPLIRHAEPEVARAALLALGRIANDETVPVVRQALLAGPEAFRPDAAAACLLAAEQQMNLGKADIAQALYDAVRETQVPASYRIGATRGAILARKADRVAFLVRQLRSSDPAIRNVALLTIRTVPSDELAGALNSEIEQAPSDLQVQLLTALKDCHNVQSLQVIRAKTRADNARVRLTALRVLASVGGSDDASTFLDVVRDSSSDEERAIALNTLERLEGSDVDDEILAALRRANDAEARVELIRLLDKRHVTGATRELLQQASGSNSKISVTSFQALKSLAGFDELPQLIALTKTCRDESARDAAVNAVIGACKNSDDVDHAGAVILKELKVSTAAMEKESWIRVLTSLGYSEALPTITAALRDTDSRLVQSTISHLSRWPDPAPMDALFNVLEGSSDSSLRRQALMAILQLTTSAADQETAMAKQLIAWFQRAGKAIESVQEKRALISGLSRVKHIESVRLSASFLNDRDVKIEAVHAILSAAEPLAKGPDGQAVGAVLDKISGIEDQRLLDRIASLRRDINAATAGRNK